MSKSTFAKTYAYFLLKWLKQSFMRQNANIESNDLKWINFSINCIFVLNYIFKKFPFTLITLAIVINYCTAYFWTQFMMAYFWGFKHTSK